MYTFLFSSTNIVPIFSFYYVAVRLSVAQVSNRNHFSSFLPINVPVVLPNRMSSFSISGIFFTTSVLHSEFAENDDYGSKIEWLENQHFTQFPILIAT